MSERREPDPFLDSFTGLVTARALSTAVMLGVFDALAEEPASAAELAQRLSLDALGAETLLTSLLTLGYVDAVAGDRFA
ncbi:MAG: methyltransferase family protein, partial [Pseudonocardiaceae bacterium]